MFRAYYQALAKRDLVLAKEVKLEVDKPLIYIDGLSKFKFTYGKILLWGVIFKTAAKNKKTVNAIIHIDDIEKFQNDFIIGLMRKMTLNERNNDKEIKEVERIVTWMMAVRKAILEVVSMIVFGS